MSSFFTKHFLTVALAPVMVVMFLMTSAHATSFNWSYTFGDMTTASGMLEGDIDPIDPNIVNVTAIMGSWTGDPTWAVDNVHGDAGTVSFDGIVFNLIAFDTELQLDLAVFQLRTIPTTPFDIASLSNDGVEEVKDLPLVPERWSLTAKTLDTPATWTLMLFGGTGMLGLLAWARRRDDRS